MLYPILDNCGGLVIRPAMGAHAVFCAAGAMFPAPLLSSFLYSGKPHFSSTQSGIVVVHSCAHCRLLHQAMRRFNEAILFSGGPNFAL